MEKSKNYRVLVEQVDRFSYEFSVSAASEAEAKRVVERMIEDEPLDGRKDAYDSTDVALEVVTDAIQNLIRENKVYRIDSSIQTGRKYGMFLLDDNLFGLWKNNLVEKEEILLKARKPAELAAKIAAYERGLEEEEEFEEEEYEDDDDDDDEDDLPPRRLRR